MEEKKVTTASETTETTAPETAETKASETMENKTKNKITKSNIFIVTLSLLLLFGVVWSTVQAAKNQYESELDTTYESLSNSLFAMRNLISFEDSFQSSYENFDLREAKIFTDVAKIYFDYKGVTETTLSDFAYRMGDCEIFFYPSKGSKITSDNADKFLLDDSQMRKIKTVGELETENYNYTAVRLDDGWLYIQWEESQDVQNVGFDRILETCPSKLCVVDNETGEIIASSGDDDHDFLDEKLVNFDEERTSHKKNGIQAGFCGSVQSDGIYFANLQMIDRYSVYAFTPLRSVVSNALRTVAPEYGLMLLIFIFIWFCAMRMRKQGESIQDQEQCQQFTKDYYINLPVARHTATLLLIGLILTVAISIHLPLLANYTKHNAKMENSLNSFINEMQISDEEWEKISDRFSKLITDRAMMIAEMKNMMGMDFDEDTMNELARSMDLVSVLVYDEKGKVVMSTDGYVGYKLSENPDDDEYALWTLLNNAEVSLTHEKSDGSGYYVAVRRLDAPGIICATLTNSALSDMREQTDINEALLRVNTDTYAKMYTSAEKSKTLLWATTSSEKVRAIPNNLSKSALLSRYCGVQKIGGYEYYLNTMSDDEHVIISAERTGKMTKPVVGILMRIIPVSLILALAILLMSCVYREIDDWLKDDYSHILTRVFSTERGSVKKEDTELDETLKKMATRLIGGVFAILIAMYVLDAFIAQTPVSDYLFSKQWEHKLGVFSITTIMLSVAFAVIGLAILKKLLEVLSGRMASRAKTISNLIMSIVQFFVIVFVAIYALHQVGVDTSVILTSAGVLSIIIGYGSQSIVCDLVSGIFLIMEDQIRVGDTLFINGFRGEVERIGLRTTTLKHYADVRVINNSNMAGFSNFSRTTNASRWEMSFPVEQDIDQVKSLIMDNKERFQKVCKGNIIAGPIWIGVSEGFTDHTGHAHYCIQVLFVTDIEEWNSVLKRTFETAYRIMLENGIHPSGGERKKLSK